MDKSIRYEDFKAQLLTDPEVRAEYEALEPEFRLIRDTLLLREELAGMKDRDLNFEERWREEEILRELREIEDERS